MKYFVYCKEHHDEKIYINFGKEVKTKNELTYECFSLICPTSKTTYLYNINEVKAEVGPAFGGALVGALLFIIDPVLGLIGSITGLLGMAKIEQEKVNKFNNSTKKQVYS